MKTEKRINQKGREYIELKFDTSGDIDFLGQSERNYFAQKIKETGVVKVNFKRSYTDEYIESNSPTSNTMYNSEIIDNNFDDVDELLEYLSYVIEDQDDYFDENYEDEFEPIRSITVEFFS